MTDVPPYLKPSEVARACEITRKKAKSMLRRAGILERLGGHDVVSESRLRERLQPVYDRVFAYFVLQPQTNPSAPR